MNDASETAQLPGSILGKLSDMASEHKASLELNPRMLTDCWRGIFLLKGEWSFGSV